MEELRPAGKRQTSREGWQRNDVTCGTFCSQIHRTHTLRIYVLSHIHIFLWVVASVFVWACAIRLNACVRVQITLRKVATATAGQSADGGRDMCWKCMHTHIVTGANFWHVRRVRYLQLTCGVRTTNEFDAMWMRPANVLLAVCIFGFVCVARVWILLCFSVLSAVKALIKFRTQTTICAVRVWAHATLVFIVDYMKCSRRPAHVGFCYVS